MRPARSRPPVPAAFSAAVALCLLAVVACSGRNGRRLIPPPPESVARITTAPPASDFTGVALEPVPGRTTVPKVDVLGGEAILNGIVVGPEGPVGGATVRLERLVGDAIGRLDVISNADGTWRAPQPPRSAPVVTVPAFPQQTFPGQPATVPPTTAPPTTPAPTAKPSMAAGIFGGRYRVRAWRSPDVALTTPQILFVEARQDKNITLQLSRYSGTSVSAFTSPDPPVLDATTNVTAVVTSLSVDADGVVRSVPAAGVAVTLNAGAGFEVTSGSGATNGQGRATFQVRCTALGASQLDVTVNQSQTYNLPVRPCTSPAPTTTTSTTLFPDPSGTSSSSSTPPPTTGTTRPRP